MSSDILNNYWPALSALFFALIFILGKISDRKDRINQQSWMAADGEIIRVYQHPKLNAYYVKFSHHEKVHYFEERRAFGDIAYNEGDTVPILFDPIAVFLAHLPPRNHHVFSSKLTVGCQQAGKINDNSRTSLLMDILNVGLIVVCLIAQWFVLQ